MSRIQVETKEQVTVTVEKTACDRCSKIIEDQRFGYYDNEHSSKVLIDVEFRNQGGGCTHKYDLCDTCSQLLKQWIEVTP